MKINSLIGSEFETNISKYKIIDSINDGDEGANGILLKVEDLHNNYYAMKILNTSNTDKVKRFNDEYEFQSKSTSPYIVRARDRGEINKHQFYIMDLYDYNYSHIIKKDKKEYVESNYKKIKYVIDLCKALKYMHGRKVYHRDLKPENILYDKRKNKVLIADLGIAHFRKGNGTVASDKMGNFDYHAPEQKKNGAKIYGPYTDIYALGLIINETFTGEIPVGETFKKVATVVPALSFMDDIISTMLVQDYKKRESNISVVMNKIKIEINKLKEFKEYIDFKIDDEIKQYGVKLNNRCHEQVINDLSFANGLLLNRKFDIGNINPNYHANISYNLNSLVFNSFVIYRIYDKVSRKYFNETDLKNLDPIDLDKDKELIAELDEYLNKYKPIDYFDFYIGRIRKMFVNLEKYDAKKIFIEFNRIIEEANHNYKDAPLLWIFFNLTFDGFLNEYLSCASDCNICDLVSFNHKRISQEVEFDSLYKKETDYTSELINKLKDKFHSIEIIKDGTFSISKRDYNRFISIYTENFIDDGSVACGDVNDFYDSAINNGNFVTFKIERWQVRHVSIFLEKYL